MASGELMETCAATLQRAVRVVTILSLALCAACAGSHGTIGRNDLLRTAVYAEPNSLNPLLGNLTVDTFLASLAFDELVTVDAGGNDVPDLAAKVPTLRNGGISRDGRTIVYHLRRGVRWHDGAPFTSADVKFSWQAVMNPRNNVPERTGYDQVASVGTPDAWTVAFHLKRPYAPFVDTVFGEGGTSFRIVPKHLLGRYRDLNEVPFNQQPIGTGPFKLARWVHGDRAEYVANGRYFLGRPKLAKIVVRFVPNDNTLEALVRSHELDLATLLTPTVYQALRGTQGFRASALSAPRYASLAMNLSHPPLDDVRVRRAIAYAIDEKRLVRALLFGTGTVAGADIAPYYRWAYEPDVMHYGYDPTRADRLLDAAGWARSSGGVRTKNGRRLSLQMVFMSGSQSSEQIGVFFQSALAAVGIDVPIKTYPASLLYAPLGQGGILYSGKYDLNTLGTVAGADPDDSSEWLCNAVPPAGANVEHYCNPQLDAQERIALTHYDRAVRRRAYAAIQRTLARDVPAAFNYYPEQLYVADARLKNVRSNGISPTWNAYRWSW